MKKMSIWHMIVVASATLFLIVRGQLQNPGFISIDCGAEKDYYDPILEIYYKTDGGFISTGVNYPVSAEVVYDDKVVQAKNLRAFPNGIRNCYKLTPQQGKNNTYLIRAFFWYGNYDGRNKIPSFDLYIDVNYWATISFDKFVYEEVIYAPTRDDIHVCLVNTGLGVPLITTLELRFLNNSAYGVDTGLALRNWHRYNIGGDFGPHKYNYRHPYDVYDRIWEPQIYDTWAKITNESLVDLTTSSDDASSVPVEVLMTAGRWKNDSSRLDFGVYWNTSSPTQKWYIYLHFAEIQILNQTQVREMQVYVVDKFVQTVTLQYGKPVTVSSFPVSSPDKVNFTIKAPSYSNLPPILNAFEFMSSLDMNPMTVEDDVRAINGIKNAYAVTRDSWQGDPCSPRNFSWIGLNCSYDGNPRITSLNLSSSNLMGEIADAFGNLTSLTSLDLSNNQLTGQIPEYFGQMPALKLLNLNGNNLSGSIPDALKRKQAAGTLHASFEENPNLCQTNICLSRAVGSTGKNGEDSTNLIIPTSVSASLVIFLAIILILWRIRRRSQGGSGEEPLVEGINVASPKKIIFKYSDISTITNNFGTVLGEGGFGKVYLGTLSNGNKVAVKICSKLSSQAYKGFLAEVGMLMTVHHKNLISLVGYCNEIESTVLLYELMSNGDLKQHLSENNADVLSWRQRLSIAIDAAHGIEYLHNGCKPPIIHRDLKTSNILLNENMQAKIADFGLSKIMGMDDDSHICTRPAGTPGYLDPEFHASGRLTKKSDVYSFGIVLLELITGQPAIIKRSLGIVIHIIERVNPLIERGDIRSTVDSRLRGQFKDNAAWKAVEIAMSCVAPSSSRRPDMESVSSDLKECLRLEADSGHDNYMEGTFLGMSHAKLDYTAPEPR